MEVVGSGQAQPCFCLTVIGRSFVLSPRFVISDGLFRYQLPWLPWLWSKQTIPARKPALTISFFHFNLIMNIIYFWLFLFLFLFPHFWGCLTPHPAVWVAVLELKRRGSCAATCVLRSWRWLLSRLFGWECCLGRAETEFLKATLTFFPLISCDWNRSDAVSVGKVSGWVR